MESFFNRPLMKTKAKERLSGNWGVAIAITLIMMLLTGFMSGTLSLVTTDSMLIDDILMDPYGSLLQAFASQGPSLSTFYDQFYISTPFIQLSLGSLVLVQIFSFLFSIFMSGAYEFSYSKWMLDVQTGEMNTSFGDFVGHFRYWLKGIGAYLWMSLWLFLWSFLLIIPMTFALIFFGGLGMGGDGSESLGVFALIILSALIVGLIVLVIYKSISYSMIFYLIADHPEEMGPIRALNYSKAITKGHVGDIFILMLSFIGWFFLGAITCGLAFLYVRPYYSGTYAQAYLWLRDRAFDRKILAPESLGMQEQVLLADEHLSQSDFADAERHDRINTMADASPQEARELNRTLDQAINPQEDAEVFETRNEDRNDHPDERSSL